MPLNASILYRGPLSSCNYGCCYCPFAKQQPSRKELERDSAALRRFCGWAAEKHRDLLSVFFTPSGEALLYDWYRETIVTLSKLAHIRKIAVQTNLSCKLDWLANANIEKLGLWCTYHPDETTMEKFLDQCNELEQLRVKYSVGCVGVKQNIPHIQRLRNALPSNRYLWVNAYKDVRNYYDDATVDVLTRIDPLFPINNQHHPSLDRMCRCGSTVFAVDGKGNVRRCHFVKQVMGNLYKSTIEEILSNEPCPNKTCGCHIGYIHLDYLQLESIFGDGLLERIPESR